MSNPAKAELGVSVMSIRNYTAMLTRTPRYAERAETILAEALVVSGRRRKSLGTDEPRPVPQRLSGKAAPGAVAARPSRCHGRAYSNESPTLGITSAGRGVSTWRDSGGAGEWVDELIAFADECHGGPGSAARSRESPL